MKIYNELYKDGTMDIKLLRNFVAIVECGSLTAAAKKLFLAQPALSNQLKSLEKEMGAVLLARNSRRQSLTDAGKLFYERAKNIILMENSMIEEIFDCENGSIGCVKIAMIPSCEENLMHEILPEFIRNFPDVNFEIYERESDSVLKMLEDGVVDIGVVRTPCNITGAMNAEFISDERLVCAFREELFPALYEKNPVLLRDLEPFPIVLLRRNEQMFCEECASRGIVPRVRAVNQQYTLNIKWAQEGLGVAIVPRSAARSLGEGLIFREIGDADFVTNRTVVTMKEGFHSKAVKNFLKACLEKL